MNIVPFTPDLQARSWRSHELEELVSVYEAHAARGDACSWHVSATELEDPQFFVLGPAPDLVCIVAISRVGRTYVLENGSGQVLQECTSLKPVVTRARAPIAERPLSLAARITLGLTGIRLTIDQTIEPMLAEFEEALLRVAPQLAAFV